MGAPFSLLAPDCNSQVEYILSNDYACEGSHHKVPWRDNVRHMNFV